MRKILLLIVGVILFTSCTRQIDSDVYASRQVGEVSATYPGMIRNVREVCIDHSDRLEDNGIGVAGGGVAGGVIGNKLGRGDFAPTAAGAIVGAVTGSLIEKRMKQQMALEYVVELYNGGLMTVVQGYDQMFNIGQPVYVVVSSYGRSRIIPQ